MDFVLIGQFLFFKYFYFYIKCFIPPGQGEQRQNGRQFYVVGAQNTSERKTEDKAGNTVKDQSLKNFRTTIWADKPQKIVKEKNTLKTFSKETS